MGRNAIPIEVIKARGRSSLSKETVQRRENEEIDIPKDMQGITPPDSLTTKAHKQEFFDIAEKLKRLGIWSEIDADVLARYILSREMYNKYTKALIKKLGSSSFDNGEVMEISKIQTAQDKAFKQCQSCASALGMTITSRCKIVVPQSQTSDDDELDL